MKRRLFLKIPLVAVFFLLFLNLFFEINFRDKIYPGVKIDGVSFGGKNKTDVINFFSKDNRDYNDLIFTFVLEEDVSATLSGKQLEIKLNAELLADQAFLIGRSGNIFTRFLQKFETVSLPASYRFNAQTLDETLQKIAEKTDAPAQEALFQFSNNKVTAFHASKNGLKLDQDKARLDFAKFLSPPKSGIITLQTIVLEPKIKTEQANNLGIRELIGKGESTFWHSIPNRIYNVGLAASRLNGVLIAPNEIFSFNKALGEVSGATGFKQAYVIKEKKTVLDDGGGVCQVSTTLFRSALNAGLLIIERQAHAYRVGYYEQNSPPGLDATVFSPSVDLKIKNDTPAYILLQTFIDSQNLGLTFFLYGQKDGRKAKISMPAILSQSPPLADLYQDDPTMPAGTIKQVDFAAWGAKVSFDYKVTREEKILQNETFISNYQSWQAIFLRGTKE